MAETPGALTAATLPSGFTESVAISGLSNPTNVAFASDGRVFVTEKSGAIKVYDDLNDASPTTFTGLASNVHNYWDRGLLGMALDPSLLDPGLPLRPWIYVLYTYDHVLGDAAPAPRWGDTCPSPPGPTTDGCVVSGRLSRFSVTGTSIVGPEQVLIEDWCQQFPSHSIGSLAFGPDGALYVSGGDGASFNQADYGQLGGTLPAGGPPVVPKNPCGDPGGTMTPPTAEGGALRAQDTLTSGDPTSLDGSILRVDPVTGAAFAGNPYAGSADLNTRRIIATGLRNPFRMTFRPGSNELWFGDVGWTQWEEIGYIRDTTDNVVENFGWPCYEGNGRHGSYDGANLAVCESLYAAGASAVTAPTLTYRHADRVVPGETCPTGDSAIAGLVFYPMTGGSFPAAYRGGLFFADHNRSCIWFMPRGSDGRPDPAGVQTFAAGAPNPVGLAIGPAGDLFFPDFGGNAIRRIAPALTNQAPTARIEAEPTSGPAPLTVDFDGTTSTDPEAGALTYRWDLDGDLVYDDSTSATPSRQYDVPGTVVVGLEVTDPGGEIGTTTATISVGQASNAPPVPLIATPAAGIAWGVGDPSPISFSGSATDPEDGALAASQLEWTLVQRHCPASCHSHTVESFGGASGSFFPPDHDYPSYLELTLTATDTDGASASATRRLDPRTATINFQTVPAGLELNVGDSDQTAPFPRTFIDGSRTSVSARSTQTLGGSEYAFVKWSDDGAAAHDITARPGVTYTATFAKITVPSTLTLASLDDAGAAAGEPTTIRARVTTSAAASGTLRVRDGTTQAILKTVTVSGTSTTLDLAVTRAAGTWPFKAEFVPSDANVAAASTWYDLVVVPGPRPETHMSTTTLYSKGRTATSTFSSPGGGTGFECAVDGSGTWATCSSPHTFTTGTDGTHELRVRARGSTGLADRTAASRTWIVDPAPPVGTVAIAAGAATIRQTAVTVSVVATDGGSGVADVRLSNDGVTWTSRPYAPSQPWTLAATDGVRKVYVSWRDRAGNWSTPRADAIILDRAVPTVSIPGRQFLAGTSIASGRVTVRWPWTGGDATSGIARYEVAQQTDGGTWTTVSTNLTTPKVDRSLTTLHTYRLRVRAFDVAGNASGWATSPLVHLDRFSEHNRRIRYTGSWSYRTGSVFWLGKTKRSTMAGSTASFTFTGRAFAWVARMGPDRGRAAVYVNGARVATVDLYASSYRDQRVVWVGNWSSAASRTIKIKVLGTAGRPRVDLDAFVSAD